MTWLKVVSGEVALVELCEISLISEPRILPMYVLLSSVFERV